MNQENQEIPHLPINRPITDIEKVVIKMSKDIEFLKSKVTELETNKLAEDFKMTPEEITEQGFVADPPNKMGNARGYRPLLESEIKEAVEKYDCMAAAARYAGVSCKTFRKYARRYNLWKPNPGGRGAKAKIHDANAGKYPLNKILAGEIIHPTPVRLKELLFKGGAKKKCCERCGASEARSDGVYPLVINFIDGDQSHQTIDNIKIYCYNCTFILRGYVRRGVLVFENLPPA